MDWQPGARYTKLNDAPLAVPGTSYVDTGIAIPQTADLVYPIWTYLSATRDVLPQGEVVPISPVPVSRLWVSAALQAGISAVIGIEAGGGLRLMRTETNTILVGVETTRSVPDGATGLDLYSVLLAPEPPPPEPEQPIEPSHTVPEGTGSFEGQCQALYPLPLGPFTGATGKDNLASLNVWAESFRPLCSLAPHQYGDERLLDLAFACRGMLCAELLSLDPVEVGRARTWTDETGTVHTARADIPAQTFATALGYAMRAMYFAGVSKSDQAWWEKMGRYAEGRTHTNSGEHDLSNIPSSDVRYWREFAASGTNHQIEKSGAMRLLARYVRRRLLPVEFA